MARSNFFTGVEAAIPVVLGYLPIGFAFGVTARGAGLSVADTGLMSLFVYAGSAQFIGAAMWGAGQAAGAIIATTFLVNLRHLLMGAALAPSFRRLPPWLTAGLAYGMTDETFAVSSTRLKGQPAPAGFFIGLHLTSHSSWIAASMVGALFGQILPPWAIQAFGLDFTLPAMFIALLLLQLKHRTELLVAAVAGLVSVAVALLIPGNWNVIAATVVAATCGAWLTRPQVASEERLAAGGEGS